MNKIIFSIFVLFCGFVFISCFFDTDNNDKKDDTEPIGACVQEEAGMIGCDTCFNNVAQSDCQTNYTQAEIAIFHEDRTCDDVHWTSCD